MKKNLPLNFDITWTDRYLVQLIEHPILRIPNFNSPNLRCCKVFFFLFNITSYVGIFGCILILIQIIWKKYSKSKQTKYSRLIKLGWVKMSWTRYLVTSKISDFFFKFLWPSQRTLSLLKSSNDSTMCVFQYDEKKLVKSQLFKMNVLFKYVHLHT